MNVERFHSNYDTKIMKGQFDAEYIDEKASFIR
jgi:hypothetical protein